MPHGYNVIDDISRHNRHGTYSLTKDLGKDRVRKSAKSERPERHEKISKPKEYVLPELVSQGEYKKFIKNNDRCIIFYGASWCQACNKVDDMYRRLAARYNDRIAFAHVDVDIAKLDFSSLPVFTYVKDGNEVDSLDIGDNTMLKEFARKSISGK